MAAIAYVPRPRFWLAAALLSMTLLAGHERRRELAPAPVSIEIALEPALDVIVPPLIDPAMVHVPPATGDAMNTGVGPLAAWIGRLLGTLTGHAC